MGRHGTFSDSSQLPFICLPFSQLFLVDGARLWDEVLYGADERVGRGTVRHVATKIDESDLVGATPRLAGV